MKIIRTQLARLATFILIMSVFAGVFGGFETTNAAANPQVNYQGKLTDSSNLAVPDGTYNMRFWLLTSGTIATTSAIWSEELTGTNRVQVTNGLFSVMLGSTSPLTSVDFNQTLYLGVEVGSTTVTAEWDGEMSPRKILGTVPAAFEADKLDGLNSTQFVRTDATTTIATSSADTLLSITQNGAGDILNLFDGGTEVFSVLDGGNVGVGTSSPVARFAVAGNSYLGGDVTATGTLTVSGLTTLGNLIASNATITSATTTSLSTLTLGVGSDYVTDITGSGLSIVAGALTATGDGASNWLFDGTRLSPSTTVGIGVFASSTIGGGTGATGLTILGNATTTNAFISSSLTATNTIMNSLAVGLHTNDYGGQLIVGSTTPISGSRLSVYDVPGVDDIAAISVQSETNNALLSLNANNGAIRWSLVSKAIDGGFQLYNSDNSQLAIDVVEGLTFGIQTPIVIKGSGGVAIATSSPIEPYGFVVGTTTYLGGTGTTTAAAGIQLLSGCFRDASATSTCIGKGQAATYVVAASNSKNKQYADYIADGTGDQNEINAAITAAYTSSRGLGGKVYLLEGDYSVNGTTTMATGTMLIGSGPGTVIKLADNTNSNTAIIYAEGTTVLRKNDLVVSDLTINMNRANQTSGVYTAVWFLHAASSTVEGVNVFGLGNANDAGLVLENNARTIATRNRISGSSADFGIFFNGSDNIISNNFIDVFAIGISGNAFSHGVTRNVIEGNTLNDVNSGIEITNAGAMNVVSGNTISEFFTIGIHIEHYDSYGTIVTGNTITDSNSTHDEFVRITGDYNNVTGNTLQNFGGGASAGIRVTSASGVSENNLVAANNLFGFTTNYSDDALNTRFTQFDRTTLDTRGNNLGQVAYSLLSINGSSSVALASTTQWGSGKILSFNTATSGEVMTLANSGYLGLGSTTPSRKLTVSGDAIMANLWATGTASSTYASTTNMTLFGMLRDVNQSAGTKGMVLVTQGTSTLWVATSSLGITGGSSNWVDNGTYLSTLGAGDGILVSGSSTIGGGTGATGLTVNGGATTTGNSFIAGTTQIGTTATSATLNLYGALNMTGGGQGWAFTPGGTGVQFGAGSNSLLMNNEGLKITNVYGATGVPLRVTGIGGQTADLVQVNNSDATTLFNVTASGFVGIGTSSPSALLSVHNSAGGTTDLFRVSSSTGGIGTSTYFEVSGWGAAVNGAAPVAGDYVKFIVNDAPSVDDESWLSVRSATNNAGMELDAQGGRWEFWGAAATGNLTLQDGDSDVWALTIANLPSALTFTPISIVGNGGVGIASSTPTTGYGFAVGTTTYLGGTGTTTAAAGIQLLSGCFRDASATSTCIGKGQAATYVVAASNSKNKQYADYIADGTGDQNEINHAIQAAYTASRGLGGKIYLLEGDYSVSGTTTMATGTMLIGSGPGTVIRLANGVNSNVNLIDATNVDNITISNITISGNKANQSGGTNIGIYTFNTGSTTIERVNIFDTTGDGIQLDETGFSNHTGYIIDGVYIARTNGEGVDILPDNVLITNSRFEQTAGGMNIRSFSSGTRILNNLFRSVAGDVISAGSGTSEVIISGNTFETGTSDGIAGAFITSVISNNTFIQNAGYAMDISGSRNTISGNLLSDNGGSGANHGISIGGSATGNILSNNRIYDTAGTGFAINIDSGVSDTVLVGNYYSGTGASSISDSGTNTKYTQWDRLTTGTQGLGQVAYSLFTINGSSSVALASSTQWGSGKILSFNTATSGEVMTLANSGYLGLGSSTPSRRLTVGGDAIMANLWATGTASSTYASTSRLSLYGQLYDTNSSAGTKGMVLVTQGTSTMWVATSSLGITSSLSGGTDGYLARWNGASSLTTGLFRDNGTVSGVNATTSTSTFLVQGTAGVNPFAVASSTRENLFTITQSGKVGVGNWTPQGNFDIRVATPEFRIANVDSAGSPFATLITSLGSDGVSFNAGSTDSAQTDIKFYTTTNPDVSAVNGTLQFIIKGSTGNIGIGTSSPSAKLTVWGSGTTTGRLANFVNSASTTLFTIFDNGQVGIATTTPNTNYGFVVATTTQFAGTGTTTFSAGIQLTGGCFRDASATSTCIGKGQAATYVVAASNSKNKQYADYIADGTGDQNEINHAIQAAYTSSRGLGGKVYLLEGDYSVNGTTTMATGTMLIGSGPGTVIRLANSTNQTMSIIYFAGTTANPVHSIVLRDFKIDGNETNQSSGDRNGIFGNYVSTSTIDGVTITGFDNKGITIGYPRFVTITNNVLYNSGILSTSRGIELSADNSHAGYSNTISNNRLDHVANVSGGASIMMNQVSVSTIANNTLIGDLLAGDGIVVLGSSSIVTTGNVVSGNTIADFGNAGINLFDTSGGSFPVEYTTVIGNTIEASGQGIYLLSAQHNTVTGNTIRDSTLDGLILSTSANDNTIANNIIHNSGTFTASSDNIAIDDSDRNIITGNRITDTAGTGQAIDIDSNSQDTVIASNYYSGTGALSINDSNTSSSNPTRYTQWDRLTTDTRGLGSVAYSLFTINGSSSVALASSTQWGSGKILSFNTATSGEVMTLANSGYLGLGSTTPSRKLTVSGDAIMANLWATGTASSTYASTTNMTLFGMLRDVNQSAGTKGMVLVTQGTSTMWVATSSLGFSAGGGSNWLTLNGALTPSSTIGLRVNASSTIGDGTGAGGLTINGNSTTTGNAYFGGLVGIGTQPSTYALNVVGTTGLRYNRSGGGAEIILTDYTGAFPMLYMGGGDGTVPTFINSRGQMQIYTGGTSPANGALGLVQDTTGFVGVGTTSPTAKLTIADTDGGTSPLFQVSSSTNGTATSTYFNVDSFGRVGVGTSTSAERFLVAESTGFNLFSVNDGGQTSIYKRANITRMSAGSSAAELYFDGGVGSISIPLGGGELMFGNNVGGSSNATIADFSNSNDSTNGTFRVYRAMSVGTTSLPTSRLSVWGTDTASTTRVFDVINSASTTLLSVWGDGRTSMITSSSTYASTTNMTLFGMLRDVNGSAGTKGMVLVTQGTSTMWVATSSLGITGGSSNWTDNGSYLSTLGAGDGIIVAGSSTIGNGTAGLTLFGNATATSNFNIGGRLDVYGASAFYVGNAGGVNFYSGNAGADGVRIRSEFGSGGLSGGIDFADGQGGSYDTTLSRTAANTLTIDNGAGGAGNLNVLGSVGIGTTSPTAKLTIADTDGGTSPLFQVSSSTNGTATSTYLTVGSTGNVGIGTSNPGYPLTVVGNGAPSVYRVANLSDTCSGCEVSAYFQNSASSVGDSSVSVYLSPSSDTGSGAKITAIARSSSDADLAFSTLRSTSLTERMRIDADGRVGIGTSAPSSKLTVWGSGTSSTTALARFVNSASTSLLSIFENGNITVGTSTPYAKLSIQNYYGSTTPLFDIATTTSSAFATSSIFRVNHNGRIGIGTTTAPYDLTVGDSTNDGYAAFKVVDTNGAHIDSVVNSYAALDVIGAPGNYGQINIGGNGSIQNTLNVTSGGNLTFQNNVGGASTADIANFYNANDSMNGTFRVYRAMSVGTTSLPTSRLSVWGTGTTTGRTFDVINSASSTLFAILDNGQVGIGTTSPSRTLTVIGNAYVAGNLTATGTASSTYASTTNMTLFGMLRDVNQSAGTKGMVLVTQGTSTMWVATSSLGITGGSSNWTDNGTYLSTLGAGDGIIVAGSSTIGGGSTTTGLTINGGATTTGRAYFADFVGVGTSSPIGQFTISGNRPNSGSNSTLTTGSDAFAVYNNGTRILGAGITTGGFPMVEIPGTGTLATAFILGANSGNLQLAPGGSGSAVNMVDSNGSTVNATFLSTGNVGIGTTSPTAKLTIADTDGGTSPLFQVSSSTNGTATSTYFTIDSFGRIGIGSTTPESTSLTIQRTGINGSTTAGIKEYLSFVTSNQGAISYGDNAYIVNAPTATSTLVGKIIRIEDSTSLGNTVRGLEVQAQRGTNTKGENTGISGFGRTFGVKGTTEGDAGDTFVPAGVFAESKGTTQGNALRAYSGTITTSSLMQLFQDTSVFSGTGLLMNFGNSGGSFAATSSAKFIDLKIAGTSKFTVTAGGTTTIGDGTTANMAGLQIGYGGLCVDNDGSCTATTSGKITAVQYGTANSDLAEMYFGEGGLMTGEIVSLSGGLSIERATEENRGDIIGVVSTKPGLIMGQDDSSLRSGETAYPIGLKGRVPVRLSTENGPIVKGDRITLSSIPGVGMKAKSGDVSVGIALENFDGETAYSEGFVNQFSDDLVKAKMKARSQDTDTRAQDGCSYGGGTAQGEKPCVKDKVAPIKVETITVDEKTAVVAELRGEDAEEMTIAGGRTVKVGQALLFVELGQHLDVATTDVLSELLATTTLENGNGEETLWSRIKTLAQNFVDGVLRVTGIKTNELCVGEVCVDEATFLKMVESASAPKQGPSSLEETPLEPTGPEDNTGEDSGSNGASENPEGDGGTGEGTDEGTGGVDSGSNGESTEGGSDSGDATGGEGTPLESSSPEDNTGGDSGSNGASAGDEMESENGTDEGTAGEESGGGDETAGGEGTTEPSV